MKHTIIFSISLLFSVTVCLGQNYDIDPGGSTLSISGTSTLYDWTMIAKEFESTANIEIKEGEVVINNLKATINVRGLKSGKNKMDKIAYKAMKSRKYPTIDYEFREIESIQKLSDGFLLNTNGNLEVAGVSRNCPIAVKAVTNAGLNLIGSIDLKMSDFQIDPPEALFGTIKTDDLIKVHFNVKYLRR